MHTFTSAQRDQLKQLVQKQSKHSDYQALHPSISTLISKKEYRPLGKAELQRQRYMCALHNFYGKKILDIGANTGYFTFAALEAGADHVQAYEGNSEHASFIAQAAEIINLRKNIEVHSKYFEFQPEPSNSKPFDTGLCLNVLHHLGDDFGDQKLNIDEAKNSISTALQSLSKSCKHLWFQIGFNWKGNKATPLFKTGSKQELIEFIKASCSNTWTLQNIGIFNPKSQQYETMNQDLLARFDELGEFLNRPIFLMSANEVDITS